MMPLTTKKEYLLWFRVSLYVYAYNLCDDQQLKSIIQEKLKVIRRLAGCNFPLKLLYIVFMALE